MQIILAPGEANCSLCRAAPGTGSGACPFRESFFEKRRELERHDCHVFKPLTKVQLDKRLRVRVDQGSLF